MVFIASRAGAVSTSDAIQDGKNRGKFGGFVAQSRTVACAAGRDPCVGVRHAPSAHTCTAGCFVAVIDAAKGAGVTRVGIVTDGMRKSRS
jgi:hypothetical protein